ncbi:hypothetical protein UFOVP276_239 [uncultured Caudovirales phage]|uniref:Uncharacterized protein n=1 Tax=uncultured Caudovirales phage TaxID=2100421 RepID=A0A6J5LIQ5_9CAUD|nr:hypothetical protein UFOVP127_133 [uncultured Caudovirales phage]CAB4135283.1 hypothetical protein UFOVP276_239 [uncultured Caudovirales phage]
MKATLYLSAAYGGYTTVLSREVNLPALPALDNVFIISGPGMNRLASIVQIKWELLGNVKDPSLVIELFLQVTSKEELDTFSKIGWDLI